MGKTNPVPAEPLFRGSRSVAGALEGEYRMIGRVMQVRWVAAAVLVAGLLGMVPAMASAQAAPSTVVVEAVDFGFKPGGQTVAPGNVTFAVKNAGTRPHELIVIKSDLEPKALPLAAGRVDEAAVQIVGRMARITPPGATTGILNVNLPTGRYLVICNIGTHYAQGMALSIVSGAAGAPAALIPPGVPAPAPAQAAPGAPAPAKTGTGGPLVADTTSGPAAAITLAVLALGLVAGARVWTGRSSR